MKRDEDLIRGLLLRVEGREGPPYNFKIEGYSQDQVNYHLALLVDAGYLEGNVLRTGNPDPGSTNVMNVHVEQMTMRGHDLLNTIRDDKIWEATKKRIRTVAGSTSLAILQEVAKGVAKGQLGLG